MYNLGCFLQIPPYIRIQTDNYINNKLEDEFDNNQQWSNWAEENEPVPEPIAVQ